MPIGKIKTTHNVPPVPERTVSLHKDNLVSGLQQCFTKAHLGLCKVHDADKHYSPIAKQELPEWVVQDYKAIHAKSLKKSPSSLKPLDLTDGRTDLQVLQETKATMTSFARLEQADAFAKQLEIALSKPPKSPVKETPPPLPPRDYPKSPTSDVPPPPPISTIPKTQKVIVASSSIDGITSVINRSFLADDNTRELTCQLVGKLTDLQALQVVEKIRPEIRARARVPLENMTVAELQFMIRSAPEAIYEVAVPRPKASLPQQI